MNYLPDEERYSACSIARARHHGRAHHHTSAHFKREMGKAHALSELQMLVSNQLKAHISLSGLAYLAEASGHESPREIGACLHMSYQRITAYRHEIYGILIPALRILKKEATSHISHE